VQKEMNPGELFKILFASFCFDVDVQVRETKPWFILVIEVNNNIIELVLVIKVDKVNTIVASFKLLRRAAPNLFLK
jgi:hypothetical protein